MKLSLRNIIISIGILIFIITVTGCTRDAKKFNEIYDAFSKANSHFETPGLAGRTFSGNINKKLFVVGLGLDPSVMSEKSFKTVVQSYLCYVASNTHEHDPQKLLKPYNLQIEEVIVHDIDDGPALMNWNLVGEKPAGSTEIIWKSIASLTNRYEEQKPLVDFNDVELIQFEPNPLLHKQHYEFIPNNIEDIAVIKKLITLLNTYKVTNEDEPAYDKHGYPPYITFRLKNGNSIFIEPAYQINVYPDKNVGRSVTAREIKEEIVFETNGQKRMLNRMRLKTEFYDWLTGDWQNELNPR
ncbi:MAG: hypothetical protein ACYC2T_08930 [Bacillota bacterium]